MSEQLSRKMECPICKKKAVFVGVHDDEGNYHGLMGCEYENAPWSGLSYALHHEGWGDCPLCTDDAESTMGGMLFDTAEEAISALSPPNEWVNRVRELDELYTKLQIITGFTVEQLLEMFAAGYTLEKPDYSKSFEEMASLAETTPPNEWVSVEERLPTDERPVLAFIGYADTMNGFITTSYYFRFDPDPHWLGEGMIPVGLKTLFWMPLPAPPGKEG